MIRKIKAEDEELYLQMSDAFYHSPGVLKPVPVQYLHATFAEIMRSESYLLCYILEQAGTPAGYALLCQTFSQEAGGRAIWLDELFILPAFRSYGLGSAFLRFLEQAHPAARYRLEVEPGNARAIALYQRQGYRTLPYLQMIKEAQA